MPVVTGTPFPTDDFEIFAAAVAEVPVWKEVHGMESWNADVQDNIAEIDHFMDPDPYQVLGRERSKFSLNGKLLSADDEGQAIINTAAAARDYVMLKVLWNGTDGFTCKARCSMRKADAKAGANLVDRAWDFTVVPSSIEIVGLGPTI